MTINPKFVLDEEERPVAVTLSYPEWLQVEAILKSTAEEIVYEGKLPHSDPNDLCEFCGILPNLIDGMEYQRMIRSEWDHRP